MTVPTKEQTDKFFKKARIFKKTPLNIAYFEYAVHIWEQIREEN